MAKILVLTDLAPDDYAWKGAVAWQIILSLVQIQHEVRVLTLRENRNIPFTHPLLTVVQPVRSWRIEQLPQLLQALFSFKPDVIQTIGLGSSSLWPSLSVWPALTQVARLLPRLRRISTLFDEQDCRPKDPAFAWHKQADIVTVFSQRHQARLESRLQRSTQLLPFEAPPLLQCKTGEAPASTPQYVVVPAPVSEWQSFEIGLDMLNAFYQAHPTTQIHILGGWGDCTALQRKRGWQILAPAAQHLHMREDMGLQDFLTELRMADTLWLEVLPQESWSYLLALFIGRQLDKRLYLPSEWTPSLTPGSIANSLSRLYVEPGFRN